MVINQQIIAVDVSAKIIFSEPTYDTCYWFWFLINTFQAYFILPSGIFQLCIG